MSENKHNPNLWYAEGKKTAPISLRATLKGIRIAHTKQARMQTQETLSENFNTNEYSRSTQPNAYKKFATMTLVKKAFLKIQKAYSYKGSVKSSVEKTSAASMVRRCETNPKDYLGNKNVPKLDANLINYLDLRTYAELCGIPTGMLLLFSHMVGDEFKAYARTKHSSNEEALEASSEQLLDFIDKKIECLRVAKTVIEEKTAKGRPSFLELDQHTLREQDLTTQPYFADVSIFSEWKRICDLGMIASPEK